MKKLIMLMLTVTICLLAVLVSCVSDDGGENSAPDDSWKEQDYGTATVMGKWNKISVFIPSSKAAEKCESFRETLEEWTGQEVAFLNSYSYPTNHDIVIGYFEDREISVKAYNLLEKMEKSSYFDGRYLIYADSGEICIA